MIPVNQDAWESGRWQSELQQAFRSSATLLDYLGTRTPEACHTPDFPVLVPVSFANRMQPGDANDPLLRQVLATQAEHEQDPAFQIDPLQEQHLAQDNALLQKYAHRALLITTAGCAVNCRYCFRRHFPYQEHRDPQLARSLEQISNDPSLEEIILSGGDPLLLADDALLKLLQELDSIPHVQRLRIHTRLPIVLPCRITPALADGLAALQAHVVVVVHANHAQELNAETEAGFELLQQQGIVLLNQSVLLRHINNTPEALVALSKKLFDQGVMPYYLHMPDHVQGTQHFFVDDAQARALHTRIQAQLPGYLVPRLVREIPNEPNKVPLA